jgi:Fe-S-cluster containining protein
MKAGLARLFRVVRDHLGFRVDGIHPKVARKVYVRGASVRRCDASCCLGGTTVSLEERDRILVHARIVREAMTSRARDDSSRWFGKCVTRDPDFAGGRSTITRVLDGACVFLREDGLCALQVAGERRLEHPYSLKPSVCLLWPLAVNKGKLEVGYGYLTGRRECCAPVREGGCRSILEVIGPHAERICEMEDPKLSRGGCGGTPCAPDAADL